MTSCSSCLFGSVSLLNRLAIPISFYDFRSNSGQARSGALNAGRELPGTCSKAKSLKQQFKTNVEDYEVTFAEGPMLGSADTMLHCAAIWQATILDASWHAKR